MDSDLILASWSLGLLKGEEISRAAFSLLEYGLDSQSLREIAGMQNTTLRDAGAQFASCLAEMDVAIPSQEAAAMYLGRLYALEIVSGQLEPFEGAREIFCLSYFVDIEAFAVFTWPDTPEEIIESARHLLAVT